MSIQAQQILPAATSQRAVIHDLRNLFGIVASATHILEHGSDQAQRIALLEAIEDAAIRGGRLTTELLGNRAPQAASVPTDVDKRLESLTPLMRTLAGPSIAFALDAAHTGARARIDPLEFDAAILELVANAGAADARHIVLRTRKIGTRLWVLVCDDGRGMTPATLARARLGRDAGQAHGAGLARVHRFVRSVHGQMRIRSRRFGGTSVALILPAMLSLAVDARG